MTKRGARDPGGRGRTVAAHLALAAGATELSRLQRALQIAGAWFFDWDLETDKVVVSDDLRRVCGLAAGATFRSAEFFAQFVHADDRERVRAALDAAIAGGPAFDADHRIVQADGSVIWVHTRAEPWRDADGTPLSVLGTSTDITRQRLAESLPDDERPVLEMIARNSPQRDILDAIVRMLEGRTHGLTGSILVADADGRQLRHGAAPGLPDDLVRAMDHIPIGPDAGPPGRAAFVRDTVTVADVAADPLARDFRDVALAHGLRTCWFTPIETADQRVVGVFGLYGREPRTPGLEDLIAIRACSTLAALALVHERERTERLRIDSEFRASFYHSNVGKAQADPETKRFVRVNQAFCDFLGYSEAELLEMTIPEVWHPQSKELGHSIASQLRSGQFDGSAREMAYLRKDGSTVYGLLSPTMLFDSSGKPMLLVAVVQDLTERKRAEQAAVEATNRQRAIAEELALERARLVQAQVIANVGSWETDPVTFEVTWSDQTHRIFETDPHTFRPTHASFLELVHPDDRAAVDAAFVASLGSPHVHTLTHRLIMPDGRVKHVEERWQVLVGDDGTPIRATGTCRDLTTQVQEAARINALETRLKLAISALQIGIWDLDLTTGEGYASPEWKALFGYADHEFTPTAEEVFRHHIHPDDAARIEETVRQFADSPNGRFLYEFRMRHKDGSYRWIESHAQVFPDASGRAVRATGFHLDITRRKAAEARQVRLLEILKASVEEVYICDATTLRFDFVNECARTNLGYSMRQLRTMTPVDIAPQLDEARFAARLAPLRNRSQAKLVFESVHRRADGSEYPVEVHLQLVELPGDPVFLAVVIDISERLRTRALLEDSHEQLRAMLVRLQRAQEEERIRVARDVHDELGQLLTGLKMDVRWLERKLSEPGLPSAQLPLLDRAVAASELVDATIASVQRIAAELRPDALDALGLEAALRARARDFASRTGIQCVVTVEGEKPPLAGETAIQLFYIFQEALTNVSRHSGATKVDVCVRTTAHGIELDVTDDGIGLPDEVATSQSLGLRGMHERAFQCGGIVVASRIAPRGTRVSVRIPNQAPAR